MKLFPFIVAGVATLGSPAQSGEMPPQLRVGRAGHAFDHVGAINDQAKAAAASGATIIYAGGFGSWGYEGLPPADRIAARREALVQYNRQAREQGIELVIGYLCATSIVKLDAFDEHWSDELRGQLKTPPEQWRQMDRQGQPLASWYGGDYNPACMNNPDWRSYERYMVRQQLEAGHDGIFFDNPTVHPLGCYCGDCMTKFAEFLRARGIAIPAEAEQRVDRIERVRELASAHPREFMRFRCITARDFLAEMREYARTINPNALITCNNSLNTPDSLYAQCRVHAYNIGEMSKAEDFVVVEDMRTQPRVTADGQWFEYGPTYKQLHAISHGKPIVAVTLADGDYHTAPNLVRLAMAEAAAHGASYLSWPTWPEAQRERMIAAIRPQAELLRQHQSLLNDAAPRADVILFLPWRRWEETEECIPSKLAAALTRENIQYVLTSEDDFALPIAGDRRPVFLVESFGVLTPAEKAIVGEFEKDGGRVVAAEGGDWLSDLKQAIEKPSLVIEGSPHVRATVHDQPGRTIVHVYNLNVERLNSFEDKVTPATDLRVTLAVPRSKVSNVHVYSAADAGASGTLHYTIRADASGVLLEMTIPRIEISAVLLVE